MRLYNLRLERDVNIRGEKCTRVICDVEANFSPIKELYFWVNTEFGNMLTHDVYDAFLVAMLYPAMHYEENIEICGKVSKNIYFNIKNYVMAVVRDFAAIANKHFIPIDIKVEGYKTPNKNDNLYIGTGFSGGVDSFSTLTDHFYNETDLDYKINSLFFFHVGQYGNVDNPLTWERAKNRFSITSDYAKLIGVPAIMMSTNLFDFYQPEWEYSGGLLIRCASILIFQKTLKRYYLSNSITYLERAHVLDDPYPGLADVADPIIPPLLSNINFEILDDGEQYTRSQKTANLINNSHAQNFLNVCVNTDESHIGAENCGICHKCLRTMFTLDILGALGKFEQVFDRKKWEKQSFKYKCQAIYDYNKDPFAKDSVDLARKVGYKLPSQTIAYTYVYTQKVIRSFTRIYRKIINIR